MCLKGESPNEIRKVVLYDHFKIQSQIQKKKFTAGWNQTRSILIETNKVSSVDLATD